MIESLVETEERQRSVPRREVRFTRRELRSRCGMSDAAIRVHLERLVTLEYVRSAVGRNGFRFEYELLFDGDLDRSTPQMVGLIEVGALATTTATSQGEAGDLAPHLQAARTELAPGLPNAGSAAHAAVGATSDEVRADGVNTAHQRVAALDGRSVTASHLAPASSNSSSLVASGSSGV
jgi:hypothetical protein